MNQRGRRIRRGDAAVLVLLLSAGAATAGSPSPSPSPSPPPPPSAKKAAPPPVGWLNYREAKAASRHRDRPLLIYFSAAASIPSARLDRETWTDRRLRRYLDDHLIAARVDMQDMPAVAHHFEVTEVPSMLFLAPDGQPLVVLRGFHGPKTLLRAATYVGTRAWTYADYDTWLSRNLDR